MKDRAVDTFNSVVSGISGALSGVYSAVVNGVFQCDQLYYRIARTGGSLGTGIS